MFKVKLFYIKPSGSQGMPKSSRADLQQAYQLFNEINIIAQLSANAFERLLPHQLSLSQFAVLNWFVRVDDEATPGRLASAFQVSKGAMTNTLKRLAEKGLITVSSDPESGRRKLVQLTRAGRHARDEAIAASEPLLNEILGQFPAGRVRALLPELIVLRELLDRGREAPV